MVAQSYSLFFSILFCSFTICSGPHVLPVGENSEKEINIADVSDESAPDISQPKQQSLQLVGGALTKYGLGAVGVGLLGGMLYAAKRVYNFVQTKKHEELLLNNPFGLIAAQADEEPAYFRDYQRILNDVFLEANFFEKWNGYYKNPFELMAHEDFRLTNLDQKEEIFVIAKIFEELYSNEELDTIFTGNRKIKEMVRGMGVQAFLNDQSLVQKLTPEQQSGLISLHKKICSFNQVYEKAVEQQRFTLSRLDEMKKLYNEHPDFITARQQAIEKRMLVKSENETIYY